MSVPVKRRTGDSTTNATVRMYATSDGETIVGPGDPRAAFLIATPGRPIPEQYLEAAQAYLSASGAGEDADGASPPSEGDTGAQGGQSEAFDPGGHNVADVVAYLKGLDLDTDEGKAEYERVLKSEEGGQGRKGILGG